MSGDPFKGETDLRARQAMARTFDKDQCYRALHDTELPFQVVATLSKRLRDLRAIEGAEPASFHQPHQPGKNSTSPA
jgi:hypothetical protein